MEPLTDQRDLSGGPRRPPRPPRVGDSRAPVTTIIVLALGAVAVIIGLVILFSITGEADPSETAETPAPVATTTPISLVIPTFATTTTTPLQAAPTAAKTDATVLVVNASGVGGSATSMLSQLAADGYSASKVANATGGRLAQSVVYFIPGDPKAEGVANLLAAQIPQAQVQPMPDPPPIDRPLGGATVALMIGRDIAGRALADLAAG